MLRIIQGNLLALLATLRMETLPLKLTGADFIPHPREGDVLVCLETLIPLALSNNAIEPLPDRFWISPDNQKVLEGLACPLIGSSARSPATLKQTGED
jgi:hypothetical protein